VAGERDAVFSFPRADLSRDWFQRGRTAMRSLTTWRRRPCRMLRDGVAEPCSPRLATNRQWGRVVVVLSFAAVACAGPAALAQRSAVTVDRSVLDALGPRDPSAKPGSRIRLHLPVQPAQRQPASGGSGKSAPVQASIKPPAASPPPTAPAPPAAPAPQAALVPVAPTAPQAPKPAAPAPAPAPSAAAASPPSPVPAPAAERILFPPDDANLPDEAKQELDRLAARLGADARLYLQLVAYASGGSGNDASQARRLSLSRALAARSYLVDHGVEIKQIDVRPLGNKSEPGAAPDRVDLVVTQR
jgi:outer membrane protein OmpA-like peptidoglycan-associated protein